MTSRSVFLEVPFEPQIECVPNNRASVSSVTSRLARPKAPSRPITGRKGESSPRRTAACNQCCVVPSRLFFGSHVEWKTWPRRNQLEIMLLFVHCQSRIAHPMAQRPLCPHSPAPEQCGLRELASCPCGRVGCASPLGELRSVRGNRRTKRPSWYCRLPAHCTPDSG